MGVQFYNASSLSCFCNNNLQSHGFPRLVIAKFMNPLTFHTWGEISFKITVTLPFSWTRMKFMKMLFFGGNSTEVESYEAETHTALCAVLLECFSGERRVF